MRALLALCFSAHLIRLDGVEGYAEGAPKDQCVGMTPMHGANNFNKSLFSVSTADHTFNAITAVQVTIKGEFTGFLLQARETGTANIVGTWGTPPNGTKYLQCTNSRNDAMTHTSNDSKRDLVFNWIPPGSNAPSSIEFIATVVKLYNEWQGNVTSQTLKPSGYGNPAKTTANAAAGGGGGGAPTTTNAAAGGGGGGAKTTTKAAAAGGGGGAKTTTKAAAAGGGGGAQTTTKAAAAAGGGGGAKTTTKAAAGGGGGGAKTTTKAAAAGGGGGAKTTTKAAAAGGGGGAQTTTKAAAGGAGGAQTTVGSDGVWSGGHAGYTTAVGKGGSSAGRLLCAGVSLCLGATLAAVGATCRD
ncbi:uncharacterized protein LOC142923418 [Petromyzon marinus]|uniref:uncharacterized protein LOC116956832 n=1 Tax=Petromyzon marinus TaxID=7757 RepID=UPI003F6E53DD